MALNGAGVTLQEFNASQLTGGVSTTVGAITAAYKRGPVGPNLVTGSTSWSTQYGPLDTSWGYGGVSAQAFLTQSNQLWFNRVVDGNTCTYACADVFNGSNPLGSNTYTYIVPGNYLDLTYANIASGGINELLTYTLNVSAPWASGSQVTISASVPNALGTGSNTLVIGPVAWATTSDAMMSAISSAISVALNNYGIPCTSTAVNVSTGTSCLTIQVLVGYSPGNATYLNFNNITITGSTNTFTSQKADLFQVFARDPGAYGSNIGINITNANTAAPPNISLTSTLTNVAHSTQISGSVQYNNRTYALSASATSASACAQNFINLVTNTFGGNSTGLYSITGTTLAIILYAPVYNATWTVDGTPFTGLDITATSPFTISAVSNANSVYNYFNLNVYLAGSTIPVETFQVSLNNQVNGFGYSQFIETVVNVGSNSSPSNYIRVAYNVAGGSTNPAGFVSPSFLTGVTTSNTSPIVFLGGGQDGIQPTDSEIIAGWNQFASTDQYQVQLLINAGYTDVVVQQAIVSLAQNRQDCFAILDMPPNLQATTSATNYVSTTLGINSSYGAIYTPNLQILNPVTNQLIYVPPSGYIAAQYSYTDINFAVWLSAAGYIRGVLQNVVGLYITYGPGDRTSFAPYNINSIKAARGGLGNVIWDVLTLSQPMSLLSYVSIRRTFIFLEQSIIQVLNSYVFNNITTQTEFLITQAINNFLQPIQNQQGIANFYVLCNTTNNPGNVNNAGVLNVTVYIVPVVPARVIALKAVVTPNTVTFQELISSGIF